MNKVKKIFFTVVVPLIVYLIIDYFIYLSRIMEIILYPILIFVMTYLYPGKDSTNFEKIANIRKKLTIMLASIVLCIFLLILLDRSIIRIVDDFLLMCIEVILALGITVNVVIIINILYIKYLKKDK